MLLGCFIETALILNIYILTTSLKPLNTVPSERSEHKLKRITVFILLMFFLAGFTSVSPVNAQGLTRIYVNGVRLGVYPVIEDGVAYLPANSLAQALGISISWDARTRIVKIDNKVIATSPLLKSGMLYLPVESIISGAGGSVEWDGASNSIRITKSGAPSLTAAVDIPQETAPSPVISTSPQTAPQAASDPVITASSPSETPSAGWGDPSSSDTSVSVPVITAPKPSVSYMPSASSQTQPQSSGQTSTQPVHSPPSTYSGQPTKSAYPDQGTRSDTHLRPTDAPPSMPQNLSLPPMHTTGAVSSPDATFTSTSPFIPKSENNGTFRVTVTNIEYVNTIKDYYKPRPGYQFVVVYLSQQNVSDEVQIYTGRFSLLDQSNNSFDYIEGLSNFWLVILRPGGVNFGYLVFEIPSDAKPMKAVLHGLNQAPLSVSLR